MKSDFRRESKDDVKESKIPHNFEDKKGKILESLQSINSEIDE